MLRHVALKRLLVLIKHYASIARKLQSNNAILQNMLNMDCYIEVYEMLKFHIHISRYRTIVKLTVVIMNIMLQEVMSIQNI